MKKSRMYDKAIVGIKNAYTRDLKGMGRIEQQIDVMNQFKLKLNRLLNKQQI